MYCPLIIRFKGTHVLFLVNKKFTFSTALHTRYNLKISHCRTSVMLHSDTISCNAFIFSLFFKSDVPDL